MLSYLRIIFVILTTIIIVRATTKRHSEKIHNVCHECFPLILVYYGVSYPTSVLSLVCPALAKEDISYVYHLQVSF